MPLADIKAQIVAVIQGADPKAKVYTRMRAITPDSKKAELIGTDGVLHVWQVRREMTALLDAAVNQNLTEQKDTLVMEGFYGVNDAADSEEEFDLIVDAVLQAVNADRRPVAAGGTKLNGTVQTAETPALRKMDFVTYAEVLCHHVEIVMTVTPQYLQ